MIECLLLQFCLALWVKSVNTAPKWDFDGRKFASVLCYPSDRQLLYFMELTFTNHRTSMVKRYGVPILRVNTVFLGISTNCWITSASDLFYSSQWYCRDSKCSDQTVRMRRLIWAFAVCIMFLETFSLGIAHLLSQHIVNHEPCL